MLQSPSLFIADLAACLADWTPTTLTFSGLETLECLVDRVQSMKSIQTGGVTLAGSSKTILVAPAQVSYSLLIPEARVTLDSEEWTVGSISLEPETQLAAVELRPLV